MKLNGPFRTMDEVRAAIYEQLPPGSMFTLHAETCLRSRDRRRKCSCEPDVIVKSAAGAS